MCAPRLAAQQIDLYGRVFQLTSADNFTKSFLAGLGIDVGDDIGVPTPRIAALCLSTVPEARALRGETAAARGAEAS